MQSRRTSTWPRTRPPSSTRHLTNFPTVWLKAVSGPVAHWEMEVEMEMGNSAAMPRCAGLTRLPANPAARPICLSCRCCCAFHLEQTRPKWEAVSPGPTCFIRSLTERPPGCPDRYRTASAGHQVFVFAARFVSKYGRYAAPLHGTAAPHRCTAAQPAITMGAMPSVTA